MKALARAIAVTGVSLLAVTPPAAAQPAANVQGPRARSSVDRTAIWVADRVAYTVEIVCDPGVDVLLDDLAKEKLRLNGLEVVSNDASQTTDASDRITHRLRYVLTTYRVDSPLLSIEPLSVRYYARRPGQRLQDVAPAGEVQIPGAILAFRSTLPENLPAFELRDGRAPLPRQPFFARAEQIGLALVVVSLVPALVIAVDTVRRRSAGKPARRSARQSRQDHRATLDRLRSLDVGTEEQRRRAYDEISAAVRVYAASHSHVRAEALTAQELEAALADRGGRLPRETIVALLASCDDARYAPAQAMPPPPACREAIATAEQLLSGR